MMRLPAAAAALATAVLATVAATTVTPALAAGHPIMAPMTAAHAKTTKTQATSKKRPKTDPLRIVSLYKGGKYMSVVTCKGTKVPPPLHLKASGSPLTLRGVVPSAAELESVTKNRTYTTVYTCTIVVEEDSPAPAKPQPKPTCELPTSGSSPASACHRKVALNTGFGGEAASVARHHPRG